MSLDLSTTLSPTPAPFVDRRTSREPAKGGERRQFGSSHANLSPAAKELAVAIDEYIRSSIADVTLHAKRC